MTLAEQIKLNTGIANPFRVESPEKLTASETVDLFIVRFTQLETIKQRKHTFIWGSRGSGKSMMLRYLEPQCQAIIHGSMASFLKQEGAFLAIYCPCKEGELNKTELLLLDRYTQMILTEHMMNLLIACRLVACLRSQFPVDVLSNHECTEFVQRVVRLFDRASIASSIQVANEEASLGDDPLGWLQTILEMENRKVGSFLKTKALRGDAAVYEGSTSGYHDFLLPLMNAIGQFEILRHVPVYVLLDDAGRLMTEQQNIINTWVANRDHAVLCLKLSAERAGYKSFLTRDSGLIEEPHDYSEVDVDELYTRDKSEYFEKVKLIANRRLELASVPTKDIGVFLPPDAGEEALLNEFKQKTAEEWESTGKSGRKNDYVTRLAVARLFQHLRATKKRKSYAGFENMVHLSSGVVRDFLEPCYLMFDKCVSAGDSATTITQIPPNIQDDVLRKYSEDFILQKFQDLEKKLPFDKRNQIKALHRLVQSLGQLFYERLHDPDAREARLFSFTVRGQVPDDVEEVLRLGVQSRYFQHRTYSTKEGGGREDWYILNRRLCPAFKLDPTGFEGRISLTPELLKLACEDTAAFVRLRLKQEATDGQQSLFVLEETDDSN